MGRALYDFATAITTDRPVRTVTLHHPVAPRIRMITACTLSLRPATAADAPLIAAMHAASWQATYRHLLPAAFLDRDVVDERAAYWRARMEAPGGERRLVLIAQRDDTREPVGFVCVEKQPDSPWGVLLDNLHALPAHQGIGVGKRLMRAAQDWARAQGDTQLYLYVLEGNAPAIAFYERQGWEYSGAEPDHMGGADITALRYVFRLDASPR
ncbi:ribosomal protein S18 acetylase RimI-like enzyme [Paraburkholderia caballeronis]|uniref:Ribosomal protein S18 acetylase RimI n=2 Tax=Paraburkholderia caballeronis TaxID=416943 RepID=A0A1H7US86_9BURK|nr:ribosomal protein S18 acetylase RimI-like enzyme [Paraburkholderia caballeronis]PXX02205.1 ribosomal protein S18 acetylase RimI-like enzyme [Paraburkholderia caballeronis]RAK01362.1 ribosomal protein S18 acetylase RimI-like enzyme [Paraburkholderia caballeronis]TDV06205.1 ribosomal protein S18 acetylase RimI-like enzyme [Paraburkholderia caballeronis]TDV09707.1 ribosomal protein S18 acetylase RimI-like enzyme [Paraburkholderia caballeronis]